MGGPGRERPVGRRSAPCRQDSVGRWPEALRSSSVRMTREGRSDGLGRTEGSGVTPGAAPVPGCFRLPFMVTASPAASLWCRHLCCCGGWGPCLLRSPPGSAPRTCWVSVSVSRVNGMSVAEGTSPGTGPAAWSPSFSGSSPVETPRGRARRSGSRTHSGRASRVFLSPAVGSAIRWRHTGNVGEGLDRTGAAQRRARPL